MEEPKDNAANEQMDAAKGDEGWELDDIRIKAAENGFTITASYCKDRKEKKGESVGGRDYNSEDYVAESLDKALDKVRELAEDSASGFDV